MCCLTELISCITLCSKKYQAAKVEHTSTDKSSRGYWTVHCSPSLAWKEAYVRLEREIDE